MSTDLYKFLKKSQTNKGVFYGNIKYHENFVISGKDKVEIFAAENDM